MKEIIMSNGNIKASEIGLGCMRLSTMDKTSVNKLINTALKCGINFFWSCWYLWKRKIRINF